MHDGSAADASSSCGIELHVTGAAFAPASCAFEIISGGPTCGSAACGPTYSLAFSGDRRPHLLQATLSFPTLKSERYRYHPTLDQEEFNGYVLDEGAVVRNLVDGEITLDLSTTTSNGASTLSSLKATFELSFASDIQLDGAGVIPVRYVAAP
jgi:hypothetical protein